MVIDRLEAFANVLALVSQWDELTPKEHKVLVERFAELLQPYGVQAATQPLRKVLREAAQRAGWTLPSVKAEQRQKIAARGRTNQREDDLAHRRILISYLFKNLQRHLREKPGSTATAQAIIGRLEDLPWNTRKPPMTVRTIQADILFLRKNGNYGI